MWLGYVFRELGQRRRQAAAVVAGIGVAVAVVVVISGVSQGLKSAQTDALASLYGVGTDVTVTKATPPGSGAPQFTFGKADGSSGSGSKQLTQSKLTVARGLATSDVSQVARVAAIPAVSSTAAVLMLDNYDFSGIIPDITGHVPSGDGAAADGPTGADGSGGSSFGVDTFSVAGVDVAHQTDAGLLAGASATAGRLFTAADIGQQVALVDAAYATENQLAVGGPVNIGGVDIPVVGLVSTPQGGVSTGANAYLPLDVAQTLSGLPGQITHVYVKAVSASDVAAVSAALRSQLPDAVVATQADLAGSITGTLTAANDLSSTLGQWLTLIALAAASIFAALFTVIGVSRRTREFGTLKALGWKNRHVSSQVVGETLVEGVLGALTGLALGGIAIVLINAFAPSFSASLSGTGVTAQIPLTVPLPIEAVGLAIALAVAAAVIAALAGTMRVARLRPSEALRSAE
ncbi:MAG: Membrane protein [Subtercola sp.]|nr:Membrane protein [Subtercola sp.]